MNRQLSVSRTDLPWQPFPNSTPIDSVSPSVCQLPFQLPLRPDTPSVGLFYHPPPRSILCHVLCVDCLFSTAAAPRHLVTFCVSITLHLTRRQHLFTKRQDTITISVTACSLVVRLFQLRKHFLSSPAADSLLSHRQLPFFVVFCRSTAFFNFAAPTPFLYSFLGVFKFYLHRYLPCSSETEVTVALSSATVL